jgi:adenylate cyclase
MRAGNKPRALLNRLLSERNQHPERAAAIDEKVRRAFERRVAILVLDMCGFSRLTARHGIVHFLAMIRQMEEGAGPAVTGNGGRVVKQEADNLFAVFEEPAQALEAALDIFRAFDAMNAVVPEGRDLHGSIGIGYGDTLVVGDEDLFGNEMNLACKLGEDVAGQAEILLTAAAHAALPKRRYSFVPDSISLGGLVIPFYRFEARRTVRPRKDAKASTPRRRPRPR